MSNDNILLICEDEDIIERVLANLVLLRESDSIAVCDYKTAHKILETPSVSIVILHEKDDLDKTLKYIESIKSKDYEIILLANRYDQNTILAAYDAGVRDYFSIYSEPYEMLIRTINCFKDRTLKAKSYRDSELLKHLNAIDFESGFYKYKFCKDILNEYIKDAKTQNGMFIILTLDEQCKTKVGTQKLSKAIENSVRGDDLVVIANKGHFYLILPNIDEIGAFAIIDKIQNLLPDKFCLRAGISKIYNKDFDRIEKESFAALTDALQNNETYVYLEEKLRTQDEWLDDCDTDSKKYKLFKTAYNNKLEKVISPVFYRTQKSYEAKLCDTKIEQYADALQSVFQLKHKKQQSRLRITHPGFAKITIDILHDGLDSPENSEIEVSIDKITPKMLEQIMETFIKEFQSTLEE